MTFGILAFARGMEANNLLEISEDFLEPLPDYWPEGHEQFMESY